MDVVKTGKLPDGAFSYIEDWSMNYPGLYTSKSVVAAYPISKYTLPGYFAPKAGETFRAQFDFDSAEQAEEAFDSLVNGEKQLTDYIDRLYYPRHAPCLTGKE